MKNQKTLKVCFKRDLRSGAQTMTQGKYKVIEEKP